MQPLSHVPGADNMGQYFSSKKKSAIGELIQSALKRFLHLENKNKNNGERCYRNPNITVEATFQAISH